MSTNKFISYILCNKGIIVNLSKLHFSSFYFSFQPNKRVFHFLTFLPLQPNTQEGKINIFHHPTFSSSNQTDPKFNNTFEVGKKKKKTQRSRPITLQRVTNWSFV